MGRLLMLVVDDADFRLHQGDVLAELAGMADGSVDCVITSPPYWGLRDYGTGSWDGCNPDCDHAPETIRDGRNTDRQTMRGDGEPATNSGQLRYWASRDVCGKCGAARVDQQLGLEATPDLYVAAMVAVFREVRRVLADHGTAWINLGDSYNSAASNDWSKWDRPKAKTGDHPRQKLLAGLKPKDLVGIPWRVAFALQADGWYLRSEIIWHKPAPMPESVTDRPTKAHEQIFLLTKRARYFYDAEAIREPHTHDGRKVTTVTGRDGSIQHRDGERWPGTGRNARSVWTINPQPFTEWGSVVRRRPVAADETVDGKKRTTSPDCPVHGDRPVQAPTASDGGHAADGSTRNARIDVGLGREPLPGLVPIGPNHEPTTSPDSSRSPDSSDFRPAIGRSTGTRRTLEPTTSSGTASSQTESRTARTSPSHESPAPGGSDSPDSSGTPAHTDCTCTWYVEYTEKTSHFATYPEDLVRRCLLAGCPEWVCGTCGKPRERLVERTAMVVAPAPKRAGAQAADPGGKFRTAVGGTMVSPATAETLGWSDCGHGDYRPGVVLDPFLGSGTTALVARRHGRRCVGVELNPEYAALSARRLQQLSLLAEGAA